MSDDPPTPDVPPTRAEEWQAAGRLAADALAGMVGVVSDTHRAVSQRVNRWLPAGAAPVTAIQRGLTDAVYTGVRGGNRFIAIAGGHVAAQTGDQHAPPPSSTSGGRRVLSAVNGLFGDHVAERHPQLAVPMAIRVDDHDLSLTPEAVAAAFPHATGRLVVFVHGLVEDDRSWWLRPDGTTGPVRSYGDLLTERGFTPLYLRFNSGLRISENGRRLARLLELLTAAWPVPVDHIDVVAHSMGGLVARSACHVGWSSDQPWAQAVRTVVTLGTPHTGAPLEQAVHVADWLLRRFPETEPIGRVLAARSIGVQDLRFGSLVEEDWAGHDAEEFLRDRCTAVPFLPHTTYYWVAACVTRDIEHPAGQLLGDGLVRYPSARGIGRSRHIPFEIHNGVHLGGLHHVSLLNHPDVYDRLQEWLIAGTRPQ